MDKFSKIPLFNSDIKHQDPPSFFANPPVVSPEVLEAIQKFAGKDAVDVNDYIDWLCHINGITRQQLLGGE